jgi:O-antigen ligase
MFWTNPNLLDRALSIPKEIIGWTKNEKDTGSAGTRLDMIHLTLELAQERPFLGYGDRGYQQRANELADTIKMQEAAIAIVNTPHNEVLGKLLRSGVFGAIASILVLSVPVLMALRRSLRTGSDWSALGLLLGVLLGSLTAGLLGLSFTASFYAVLTAVLLAKSPTTLRV